MSLEPVYSRNEGGNMIRNLISGLVLIVFSSGAFAASCPLYMGEIDAALKDPAVEERLTEEQLAEVRTLRKEGEEAHRAGDHAQSMKALGRAKEILEIS
jgi:hypothetical protein